METFKEAVINHIHEVTFYTCIEVDRCAECPLVNKDGECVVLSIMDLVKEG